jgi:hypothetical protein
MPNISCHLGDLVIIGHSHIFNFSENDNKAGMIFWELSSVYLLALPIGPMKYAL